MNEREAREPETECLCISAVVADFCPTHGHLAVVPDETQLEEQVA